MPPIDDTDVEPDSVCFPSKEQTVTTSLNQSTDVDSADVEDFDQNYPRSPREHGMMGHKSLDG